jgi:hypothetical protein
MSNGFVQQRSRCFFCKLRKAICALVGALDHSDFRAFSELPPSISIHPFELILLKSDSRLAKPLMKGLLPAWSGYSNHHDC